MYWYHLMPHFIHSTMQCLKRFNHELLQTFMMFISSSLASWIFEVGLLEAMALLNTRANNSISDCCLGGELSGAKSRLYITHGVTESLRINPFKS